MTDKNDALAARIPDEVMRPAVPNLRLLATDLFNSKFFRGIESIPQALAVIQLGSELGIPPISALNMIKPIKGQLTIAARGIMALAAAKCHVTWEIIESTDKRCEIIFHRPGWKDQSSVFTIEEARAAGLVKADSGWANYPKDMLFARCGSRGARRIAPDSTSGLYSTEEIQDAVIETEAEPITEKVPSPAKEIDADIPDTFADVGKPGKTSPPSDDGDSPGTPDPLTEAEHAEDEKEKEFIITVIKEKLTEEKIDEREFKEWLFTLQNSYRPVKFYVGKMGKVIRFHMGKLKDLEYLAAHIDTSIKVFREKKEKPDEGTKG